jgi:signal transduction histidine kinase
LTASTGARLGTLCIIDRKPRPDIDRSGTAVLESLAALVVDEMDLRLARERAEAESRAKSDFIATMSHELRTPMTAVMGYVELLGETALDDHQRECVRYVRQSGNHLLQLLNDALDLSKIEAGRLVLRPERFFPAELVRQAAEVFAEMSRSKGLELRIDEVPPAASSFHADHTRIRQILFNLLSNAIKFTNEGEVSVSCAIAANSDGIDTLHLAVRDTGIGVPEGVHAILFDRFVQGDGRDTREQYGAGLGLAICRELSNAMGGSIAVEGRSEGGSCFRVAIPMATDDAGTNC